MNIGNIRTYLSNAVVVVDSSLALLPDSFDDQEVSSADTERGFKITFGQNTTTDLSSSYSDQLPVVITLYSPRDRDEQSSFDSLYTKAYAVRDLAIDPKCIETQSDFNEITSSNITPSVIGTGDKTIKMELEFIITNEFRFC